MCLKHKIIWISLFCLAFLISSESAMACQCGQVNSPIEGMQHSESVFEGRVDGRWPTIGELQEVPGLYLVLQKYKLKVIRRWKGKDSEYETLLQGFGNCDVTLEYGGFYFIYAGYRDKSFELMTASKCSATKESRYAAEDLIMLGQGTISQNVPIHRDETVIHEISRKFYTCFLGGVSMGATMLFRGWKWSTLNIESKSLILFICFSSLVLAFSMIFGLYKKYKMMAIFLLIALSFMVIGPTISGYILFTTSYGFEYLFE